MKKIAVLHRYPISEALGTNASFLEFLKDLTANNVEVFYITYKEITKSSKQNFIKYLELPFTFDRWNNFDKLIKTLLWIIYTPFFTLFKNKKIDFDLIYCDDSVPYYGFLIKLLNKKTKVFIRLGDLQSGYAWADKSPSFFRFVLEIEKFMWKKLDGIIAISLPFKKFIIQEVPILKNKVFVVEESVNLDNTNKLNSVNTQICTFLFHGALLDCKGVDLLIKAFGDFSKEHSDVKLIIAGGGPEELALRSLAANICPEKIEFTGRYNHTQLAEIMKKVDISIVMRSPNMANNFVVTTCLLENWSYKKPVLVPDLGAFNQVVIDDDNGVIFKAGDQDSLKNKLEYIYKNKDKWKKLGDNGYTTASRIFSHREIAKKMSSILISAIDKNE